MKTLSYLSLSFLLLANCGKSDSDPTPSTTNGLLTCTVDGKAYSAPATAEFTPGGSNPSGSKDDELFILAVHERTAGEDYLELVYYKPKGAPDSQYKLVLVRSEGTGTRTYEFSHSLQTTLSKTSKGWSGTFSGTTRPTPAGNFQLVEKGVFTNVPQLP